MTTHLTEAPGCPFHPRSIGLNQHETLPHCSTFPHPTLLPPLGCFPLPLIDETLICDVSFAPKALSGQAPMLSCLFPAVLYSSSSSLRPPPCQSTCLEFSHPPESCSITLLPVHAAFCLFLPLNTPTPFAPSTSVQRFLLTLLSVLAVQAAHYSTRQSMRQQCRHRRIHKVDQWI